MPYSRIVQGLTSVVCGGGDLVEDALSALARIRCRESTLGACWRVG